jgi:hypothetical protein
MIYSSGTCWKRLIVGCSVNAVLLLMVPRLGVWSSDEREFRLALLASALGTVGVLALLPVLFRGNGWQRVFGIVLLFLPSLSFWFVFDFVLKNK